MLQRGLYAATRHPHIHENVYSAKGHPGVAADPASSPPSMLNSEPVT